MFPLNDNEHSKLTRLAQDEATVLALRKLFLNHCIGKDAGIFPIELNASKFLTIHILDDAFKELSRFSEAQKEPTEKLRNPGL